MGRGELRGVAAQRSRLHLSYRLGVRGYLLSTAGRSDRQRVAAVAGAGVDVAVWAALRRTDRLLLGPRLVLDLIDVGASSVLLDDALEAASLAGVPLAMETGIRAGPLAFAVPAAHSITTTILRKRVGRSTPPATFGWQVMGAVMGMLLSWYEHREHDATVSRHGQELPAQRAAALLAGQNAVALGADTVVDELARLEYLLGAGSIQVGGGGSGQALREWKSALAAVTAGRAVYLGTALSRWARSRQNAELARDVQIRLPPGGGTTILSALQAAELYEALDELGLSGDVAVQVQAKSTQPLPGDAVALRVGHRDVVLTPDPALGIRPFDPAPLVVLAGGLWCIGLTSPAHGGAPRAVSLTGAAAALPLAWWCHRTVGAKGTEAAEQIVLRSIAHGLLVALIATPLLSAPFDRRGAQAFPATMTLLSASVLAARYEHTFSPAARARVLVAATLALAISLLPARRPIRWADLAVGAVELGTVYMAFNRVQAELDRNAEELLAQLAEQSDRARAEAYEMGRRLVVDLVITATDEARRRLAAAPESIDARVARQAAERLETIDQMLGQLS